MIDSWRSPYKELVGVGVLRFPHGTRTWITESQPSTRAQFQARARAHYAARLRAAGHTYTAIGRELDVSRERARQLVHQAWGVHLNAGWEDS
jgi:hypothetical protein